MVPGLHEDGTPDTRFGANVVGVNGMTLAHVLGNIERQFTLSREDLIRIVDHFRKLMDYGLGTNGAQMPMIPTFVTGMPEGNEKGTYLALDLGGTNLRVCAITLDGNGGFSIQQEKYKVLDSLKSGPVANLFAYMAESVDTFLNDYGTEVDEGETHLPMGFTFSFPVEQTSVDSGTLMMWTKGFSCPDAVGLDVVSLLQSALDRRHLKVRVEALVNDTVGTMLASAYQQGGALLGAIFGTGTNGAYMENMSAVTKLKVPEGGKAPTHMVVNTEWGSFDNAREVLPVTQYDNKVDRTSLRQRHHIFEKMISGMYLGEIFRSVLVNMIDQLLLFDGFAADKINDKYQLETYIMSIIETDIDSGVPSDDPSNKTRDALINKLGVPEDKITPTDIEVVRRVCRWVGLRAARLSSIALAAIILHTGHAPSTDGVRSGAPQQQQLSSAGPLNVGVDGSLVELYPHFQQRVLDALAEILGKETASRVRLALAKDGSGVGAALGALAAKKARLLGHTQLRA